MLTINTKLLAAVALCLCMSLPLHGQNIRSWIVGNTADVTTNHQPGIVLAGGATDNDDAMSWLLGKAAGGDVVVLRSSGTDGYNDYLYTLGPAVNSVETYLVDSRSKADDPGLAQSIRNAEALFIAGGDQADYVNFWKGTATGDAIDYLVNTKGVAIGGTSAGCAIQGGVYFSALNGTVTSDVALSDPYNTAVQLGNGDFVQHNILSNVVTDTHYENPDRRGRHMTFMARMVTDWGIDARGIGVEEYTAVCIEPDGTARIFGDAAYEDYAYFLQSYGGTPETCSPGTPLTWNRGAQAVKVYKVKGDNTGNKTFNLTTWESGNGGIWEDFYVSNGSLSITSPAAAPGGGSGGTCNVPGSLSSADLSSSGATLSWASTGAGNSYDLRFRESGTTTWTVQSITGTSLTLGGLSASTSYEWQVRSVCSSSNSSYSGTAVFTTLAGNGGGIRPSYCPASGNDTGSEYIDLVELRDLYNPSGDDGGYGDYIGMNTDLEAGQSYSVYLRPGFAGSTYREYWTVWIDWNRDGDYDDSGEEVVRRSSRRAISNTVSIPLSASNGPTGMRVAMQYNDYATPCENFSFGEVEDYTVTIFGALNKMGAPELQSMISLYPKPSAETLYISSPQGKNASYEIYNAQGQFVTGFTGNGAVTLDVRAYPEGVYLLQVIIEDTQTREQFLIAR